MEATRRRLPGFPAALLRGLPHVLHHYAPAGPGAPYPGEVHTQLVRLASGRVGRLDPGRGLLALLRPGPCDGALDLGHVPALFPHPVVQEAGVLFYGGEGPIYGSEYPLQLHLEEHLGLDALDPELHLVEVGVDADVYVHEVGDLSPHRDVRPEVLDLEVELIDVERWNVEDDVRVFADETRLPVLRRAVGARLVGRSAARGSARPSGVGFSGCQPAISSSGISLTPSCPPDHRRKHRLRAAAGAHL